jgi:hypothetical protein
MKVHLHWHWCVAVLAVALIVSIMATPSTAADTGKAFIGHWALTLPDGHAGWLGVSDEGGKLSASLLWAAGSVVPAKEAKVEGDTLIVTRAGPGEGVIAAKVEGDALSGTLKPSAAGGKEMSFSGKRTPPLPPAPDLGKVKFGEGITLFNGKDLDGWRLTDPNAANGWAARDGLLVNDTTRQPGGSRKAFGNLRTDREFEDFNITLETRLAKGGNSGVYLRGIYEVQVADTYGRKVDPHNMGAVYSRITPTESAEKPAGEWQTMDITLVDRHVTVVLNGKKVIDNQPVIGCTGGALWSDPMRPGPIYLQGDHTGIEYRNIVLRPVVK